MVNTLYIDEKYFVKAVATKLGFTAQGILGSVIAFSDKPELTINFNDHQNISSFVQAVDDIPLLGVETRIDKALRLAQNVIFDESIGARRYSSKVFVLVTDGSQTNSIDSEDLTLVAEEIRKFGIHLIVVGVGASVNSLELYNVVDLQMNAFHAESFDKLVTDKFVDAVTKATCKTGKIKNMHKS